MIRLTDRRKFLAVTAAAACMALSASVPAFAQGAPAGSWVAGPDAAGANTYIGRVESPARGQRVSAGGNVLVSGWAADTTAAGWAGFDSMEVWSGAKDKGGSKLVSGMVGLPRPDVAESLGGGFVNSGFSAVVPASAFSGKSGPQSLYVYLHTPAKGTWYKSASVNALAATAALAYPQDPVVGFLRPIGGEIISQKQRFNKYSFFGFALDRNAITDPANQTLGPANNGISVVNVYLDAPRGQPGSISLGSAALAAGIGQNNATEAGPGAPTDLSSFSYVTRGFGPQFDLSAWAIGTNPSTYASEQEHTAYAYARSSITGKESVATVTFFVKGGGKVINPYTPD